MKQREKKVKNDPKNNKVSIGAKDSIPSVQVQGSFQRYVSIDMFVRLFVSVAIITTLYSPLIPTTMTTTKAAAVAPRRRRRR